MRNIIIYFTFTLIMGTAGFCQNLLTVKVVDANQNALKNANVVIIGITNFDPKKTDDNGIVPIDLDANQIGIGRDIWIESTLDGYIMAGGPQKYTTKDPHYEANYTQIVLHKIKENIIYITGQVVDEISEQPIGDSVRIYFYKNNKQQAETHPNDIGYFTLEIKLEYIKSMNEIKVHFFHPEYEILSKKIPFIFNHSGLPKLDDFHLDLEVVKLNKSKKKYNIHGYLTPAPKNKSDNIEVSQNFGPFEILNIDKYGYFEIQSPSDIDIPAGSITLNFTRANYLEKDTVLTLLHYKPPLLIDMLADPILHNMGSISFAYKLIVNTEKSNNAKYRSRIFPWSSIIVFWHPPILNKQVAIGGGYFFNKDILTRNTYETLSGLERETEKTYGLSNLIKAFVRIYILGPYNKKKYNLYAGCSILNMNQDFNKIRGEDQNLLDTIEKQSFTKSIPEFFFGLRYVAFWNFTLEAEIGYFKYSLISESYKFNIFGNAEPILKEMSFNNFNSSISIVWAFPYIKW